MTAARWQDNVADMIALQQSCPGFTWTLPEIPGGPHVARWDDGRQEVSDRDLGRLVRIVRARLGGSGHG